MDNNRKILEKLKDMKDYVEYLKKHRDITLFELQEDITKRAAIERYLQIALESALDISERIIAEEQFEKPETNREAILTLGKHCILPKKFAEKFASAMGLRNILVHKYGDIDVEKLQKHLQEDLGDFNIFEKHIAEYVKKKLQKKKTLPNR